MIWITHTTVQRAMFPCISNLGKRAQVVNSTSLSADNVYDSLITVDQYTNFNKTQISLLYKIPH